ncbi:MAG: hypothetical protein Q4A82_01015 [Corynebacterium sp.]|nr:hypothetical protein [Corynebacterium sp.]
MNARYLNALRRFAAGKRINNTMMRFLIDLEYIAHDEYGSRVLTRRGVRVLQDQ